MVFLAQLRTTVLHEHANTLGCIQWQTAVPFSASIPQFSKRNLLSHHMGKRVAWRTLLDPASGEVTKERGLKDFQVAHRVRAFWASGSIQHLCGWQTWKTLLMEADFRPCSFEWTSDSRGWSFSGQWNCSLGLGHTAALQQAIIYSLT